jgi:hypothetical protein
LLSVASIFDPLGIHLRLSLSLSLSRWSITRKGLNSLDRKVIDENEWKELQHGEEINKLYTRVTYIPPVMFRVGNASFCFVCCFIGWPVILDFNILAAEDTFAVHSQASLPK